MTNDGAYINIHRTVEILYYCCTDVVALLIPLDSGLQIKTNFWQSYV